MEVTSARFVKGITGEDEVLSDGLPQFALVGRSNVGKSSLINSLTGANDMARVGKKPGKTTEINFFKINEAFYLVDLPGYGFAKASLESREKLRALIIWYLTQSLGKPQRVALVVDAKVGLTDTDKDMFALLTDQGHDFFVIANKIDRLTQKEAGATLKEIQAFVGDVRVLPFSSATKRGLVPLEEAFLG